MEKVWAWQSYALRTECHFGYFSRHFNGHFSGGPGLAGIRMSSFLILLELRMTEMVVSTGAIRHAKLQSNRHHQQTRDVVSVSTSRSRDVPYASSRMNFPMSRSRLGLEAERLGSRLGLGHEGLVSIPEY